MAFHTILLLGKSCHVTPLGEDLESMCLVSPRLCLHPFPLLIFLCIFFYVMNHSHGCDRMLHPMNLPSERQTWEWSLKLRLSNSASRTPLIMSIALIRYTGLRAQAAILNRVCDSEKEQKTGAWQLEEAGFGGAELQIL